MSRGFIPPHGGYEGLHSYKKSLIVFLATYYLAKKWVRMGSRTRDQMEQSARSGKQCRKRRSGDRRQRDGVPLRSDRLPARPADSRTGAGLSAGGRDPRAHDPGASGGARRTAAGRSAGLSRLRQAHAPTHGSPGPQRRPALLGLHWLPRLPRNEEDMKRANGRQGTCGKGTMSPVSPCRSDSCAAMCILMRDADAGGKGMTK